ncbi:MAG: site-specific DNA-methyltransferase [Candidatus Lokiarchaeota archaeon]|nr:site-specific DNA-methyltransferase [Candidatus Harpocratesius repetitus]
MSPPRKRKYIPNLAEFYFKPDFDWSIEEAQRLYNHVQTQIPNLNHKLDKIFYGDCLDLIPTIESSSIDIVIADPPFGLEFSGKERLYNRNADLVISDYKEISHSDYNSFSFNWITLLPRILKPSGSVYIFSGWTNLRSILNALSQTSLILRNHIIWEYNFAVFTKKKFATSHYHLLYLVKDERKAFFNRIQHYETDVWKIPRQYAPNIKKNGTKLPLELVRKCINYSSKPGDVVLDPFTGNATTQMAAKGEFRHFIGFEINHNLKKLIEENIKSVKPGEFYRPYKERIPDIEELKKKYPKAYKVYSKKELA